MTLLQLIVLAIVQGLTEFLPISSSGHLILVPAVTGWPDQGLAFDVAVHFGTLAGVLGYFRHDVFAIASAVLRRERSAQATLGWMIVVATIPVGVIGLVFHDWIAVNLRSAAVIAAATAGFGVALWVVDRFSRKTGDELSLGLRGALLVGVAQALALIPGTSRSGITMTAALGLGLTRQAAARFSFLISIPVIVLAAGLETVNLVRAAQPVYWDQLLIATAVSALVAYLTIRIFLRVVDAMGMAPFAIYRLCLAGALWYVFY